MVGARQEGEGRRPAADLPPDPRRAPLERLHPRRPHPAPLGELPRGRGEDGRLHRLGREDPDAEDRPQLGRHRPVLLDERHDRPLPDRHRRRQRGDQGGRRRAHHPRDDRPQPLLERPRHVDRQQHERRRARRPGHRPHDRRGRQRPAHQVRPQPRRPRGGRELRGRLHAERPEPDRPHLDVHDVPRHAPPGLPGHPPEGRAERDRGLDDAPRPRRRAPDERRPRQRARRRPAPRAGSGRARRRADRAPARELRAGRRHGHGERPGRRSRRAPGVRGPLRPLPRPPRGAGGGGQGPRGGPDALRRGERQRRLLVDPAGDRRGPGRGGRDLGGPRHLPREARGHEAEHPHPQPVRGREPDRDRAVRRRAGARLPARERHGRSRRGLERLRERGPVPGEARARPGPAASRASAGPTSATAATSTRSSPATTRTRRFSRTATTTT